MKLHDLPPFKLPEISRGWQALIGGILILLLAAGLERGCWPHPPAPIATPSSPDPYRAEAVSSAGAVGEQELEVMIPRSVGREPITPKPAWPGLAGPIRSPEGDHPQDPKEEPIIIRIKQTVQASASSAAAASAPVVHHLADSGKMIPAHGRIGVLAGTFPGILALDAQILRMDVPPWVVGMPLELGVDVAGNAQVGAVGVTAGGKAFAGLYGYSRWNLMEQGLAAGIGLRF